MTETRGPVQQFLASAAAFVMAPVGGILLGALVTPKSEIACDCERGRAVLCRVADLGQEPCQNVFGFAFPGTGLTSPTVFGVVAALLIAGLIWAIQSSLERST